MLELQRAFGNQEVERLLRHYQVQAKLAVNQSGDVYEQEADRVAQEVVSSPAPPLVQRKCACGGAGSASGECEECRKKKEGLVQRRTEGGAGPATAPPAVHEVLGSSGQPLDAATRAFLEPRFGRSFEDVRVHTDERAAEAAESVDALAFTVGRDVVFGAGQYAPGTQIGRGLLAHELVHVVQQRGTRVLSRKPAGTTQCPAYNPGEVERSHTAAGQLTEDVERIGPDKLLIADFGVSSTHLKNETRQNPLLQQWLDTFEADNSYSIQIIGYSDCAGPESLNTGLRQARASRIESLLGPKARSRNQFRGTAVLGQYVVSNDTADNRARNRGVVIEFLQEFTLEPEPVIGLPNRCGPDSTRWLTDQMRENRDHPVVKALRENRGTDPISAFTQYESLKDFRDLVRPRGPWDFKSNRQEWRAGGKKRCPSPSCDRTVVLCGRCFNYDVPGNIHYGWIGRQARLRAWFLHNRADSAQPGGVDDPRDALAIDIGVAMADNGATLCGEIKKHGDQLNLQGTTRCALCGDEAAARPRRTRPGRAGSQKDGSPSTEVA